MKISGGGGSHLWESHIGVLFFLLALEVYRNEITRGLASLGAPHPSLVTAWVTGSIHASEEQEQPPRSPCPLHYPASQEAHP